MISGAREARSSFLRRLVARALARELTAFVVPGLDVARARGLDVETVGLKVAATPRHANVLLVVGELPEGLREAAAVAYAQMPRPRAVLAAGARDVSTLPDPDASTDLGQEALNTGAEELRRLFAEGAFAAEVLAFEPDGLQPEEEDGEEDGDHHEPGHMEHDAGEEETGDHHGHDEPGYIGSEDHGGMDHGEYEGHDEGEGDDGGHEHMDHGGEGFMSMVEMTKDLPRSSDGLQMEWVEAPFGPLFPGLPGGLALTFTLDGDTVAEAEAGSGLGDREHLTGPAESFADRMARLDPHAPVAYRVLAHKAFEEAADAPADEWTALARVGALEHERAASHLGWLSLFGRLLGDGWLERRAGRLQLALLQAQDADEVGALRSGVEGFLRGIERTPLMKRRLRGIGRLSDEMEPLGPVARAKGFASDARTGEEVYRSLGFEPVVRDKDDALSRLRVRLAEISQSLGLVDRVGSISAPEGPLDGESSGEGVATVETPRGTARLRVTLEEGAVSVVELDSPSTRHLGLIGGIAEQRELADALIGVASLDLSPWEVVR